MKKITTVFLMVSGILLFASGSFAQSHEDRSRQREFIWQRGTMQPRGTIRQRGMIGQRGIRGQRQGRLLAILYKEEKKEVIYEQS